MSSIFDMVQQQLGGAAGQQIGQRLGLDPAMTQMAINAAIPAILGGMAAHAAHRKGADEIHSEADNHEASSATIPESAPVPSARDDNHSTRTGALGNVPNIFTGRGDAGGLLGKMVGHRHQAVQDGVAEASGIDSQKAGELTGMLAPIIMGAIAKKKQSDGLSPDQLGTVLGDEQRAAEAHAARRSPQMGGMLGSILSRITNG